MRRFAWLLVLAVAACAAPATLPPHKFIVFFQEWSAVIDPAAIDAIASGAQWAKEHPGAPVKVAGFADPTGGAAANGYLSLTRAQVVADQLVKDGIDRGRIEVTGQGATGYTLTSQESRRVEISIGGP
jgi:outer membrane protein OmpA-like peptidoglycan-associated protein